MNTAPATGRLALLIFTPHLEHLLAAEQQRLLLNAGASLAAAGISVAEVPNRAATQAIRQQYGMAPDAFAIVLAAADGAVLARWAEPVRPEVLLQLGAQPGLVQLRAASAPDAEVMTGARQGELPSAQVSGPEAHPHKPGDAPQSFKRVEGGQAFAALPLPGPR